MSGAFTLPWWTTSFYNSPLIFNRKLLKISLLFIVLVPIIFSFAAPLLLDNYPYLDVLTSRRLSIFTNYINENQITNYLFGGTEVRDIDNGYLTTFFNTGVMFTVFLLYLIMKALNHSIESKNYRNLAFIISFMYFNAFESLILRPEITVSICFWIVVYNSTKLSSKNKTKKVGYNEP